MALVTVQRTPSGVSSPQSSASVSSSSSNFFFYTIYKKKKISAVDFPILHKIETYMSSPYIAKISVLYKKPTHKECVKKNLIFPTQIKKFSGLLIRVHQGRIFL